jgi:hypothetical protein
MEVHVRCGGGSGIASTRDAAAAATTGAVAGIRFKTIGAVWIALDTDHRKDDDSSRFRIGIDISADAPVARLVRKSDYFAHAVPFQHLGN